MRRRALPQKFFVDNPMDKAIFWQLHTQKSIKAVSHKLTQKASNLSDQNPVQTHYLK